MSASPEIAAATPQASDRVSMVALLSICVAAAIIFASHRAGAGDNAVAVQTSPAAETGLDLALGRALFQFTWVSAPASTKSADGLGPLYNARSCAACHTVARRQPRGESGQAISSAIIFKLAG